ncbi:MAG: 50S ribosomal protein L25 [Myxococcales bacterium]|nr:50S ribosomal protein L25 [Myxococcales bacterium]
MQAQPLAIEARTQTGKGAARELRRNEKVPGVIYGPDREATSIAVSPRDVTAILEGPHRRNTLIEVELGGEKQLVLVKELQIHPVSRAILHVDFYTVSLDRPVEVKVPFSTRGRAKGVVAGADLRKHYRELPVRATPDKIPALLEVDVTAMGVGDVLKAKNLPTPEGVEVRLDGERNLIVLSAPRRRAQQDEAEAAAS